MFLTWLICITQPANAFCQDFIILKNDSILVAYPIIETRLQITKYRYDKDNETFPLADSLTNKALHKLLDGVLSVKYEGLEYTNSSGLTSVLDTLLSKARDYKFDKFSNKNKTLEGANHILIPYLIWTRTTKEYDHDKRNYTAGITHQGGSEIVTWTSVQAFLFLIDLNSNRILYYRDHFYSRGNIYLPYEQRVLKSFKKCLRPLLRKMRKGDNMKR